MPSFRKFDDGLWQAFANGFRIGLGLEPVFGINKPEHGSEFLRGLEVGAAALAKKQSTCVCWPCPVHPKG